MDIQEQQALMDKEEENIEALKSAFLTDGRWYNRYSQQKGCAFAIVGGSRLVGINAQESDYDIGVVFANKVTLFATRVPERFKKIYDGFDAHSYVNNLGELFGSSTINDPSGLLTYAQFYIPLLKQTDILYANAGYEQLITTLISNQKDLQYWAAVRVMLLLRDELIQWLQNNPNDSVKNKWVYRTFLAAKIINKEWDPVNLTDEQKLLLLKIKVSWYPYLKDELILTDTETAEIANYILSTYNTVKTLDDPQGRLNNIYVEKIKPVADLCYALDTRTEETQIL